MNPVKSATNSISRRGAAFLMMGMVVSALGISACGPVHPVSSTGAGGTPATEATTASTKAATVEATSAVTAEVTVEATAEVTAAATVAATAEVTGSAASEATAAPSDESKAAVDAATKALATKLSVDAGAITVASSEAVEWPDSCLGVQDPNTMCAQVITPGYKVVLSANGQQYEYHTDASGANVVLAPAS